MLMWHMVKVASQNLEAHYPVYTYHSKANAHVLRQNNCSISSQNMVGWVTQNKRLFQCSFIVYVVSEPDCSWLGKQQQTVDIAGNGLHITGLYLHNC